MGRSNRGPLLAALAAALVLFGQGCKTVTYVPSMHEPGYFDFNAVTLKAEGELRPTSTGESNGFYFSILWPIDAILIAFGGQPLGIPFKSASSPRAVLDALEKSEGAHILASPIIEENASHMVILPFYTRKVSATGIPVQLRGK